MPSVDVIRNITIKGKADGVDDATAALNRLTDSIKAANENLAKSNAAANDNSDGWRITGEGAATAANHMRQAAEAAYAFSPAFRGVVNEMAVPVLGAASAALAAVATGIVTATNYAGTGLIAVAGAAEKASPSLLAYTTGVRSAGIAMEAFAPSAAGAAASILGIAGAIVSRFLPVIGQILLVYDAIKLVGQAWELGGQKLAEYIALNDKAVAAGVSTDFFQRITKAAEDAKTPVDALTEAFKKLSAAVPTLDGSTAQNRLNDVVKAGNFAGNTGVGQLQSANSNEERLRALAALYDQALDKGQRLAALDIVKVFGGDQLAANLAKDSGYLDDMIEKADSIRSQDLISAGTIANAVELQNRLDAAEKILSQRWHPIQDILTNLGIKMRETWVGIVEAIANAVDVVFKLGERIASALSPLVDFIHTAGDLLGKAAPYLALVPGGLPAAAGAYSASKILGTPNTTDADAAQRDALLADAKKRLAEGLNRKFDTSHPTNTDQPDTSAYDRAEESLLKYIETTKAASLAVSDAAGEQEKFKAIAQLTAAGMKDGLTPEAAKLKAEMSGLGEKAGAAADALAKARAVSQIEFNTKTAFLSADDVAIATQLKGIYGNDVPAALNSTYASAIRVNSAFKEVSSAIDTNLTSGLTDIVSGTKSVSQGFSDMSASIIKAIEQMIIKLTIVQPLMRALQSAASPFFPGINPIAPGGVVPGAIGPTSVGGAPLVGLHAGGIVGSEATFSRYVHPAYFDDAPRFHTGGIAGDEVPIIAKRGEGVFTPGQMAAMGGGGGGSAPNITINNHTDAQPKVSTGPNGDVTITLKKMIDGAVGDSLSSGTGMRVLSKQYGVNQFAGQ